MSRDKKSLKFINNKSYKKDKNKPYYEEYDYYRERPAIWMCRGDTTHQLCEGYWLLVHGSKGPFEKPTFTAADPHWVSVWYKNFSEDQVKEFQDFMDQNKIIWR